MKSIGILFLSALFVTAPYVTSANANPKPPEPPDAVKAEQTGGDCLSFVKDGIEMDIPEETFVFMLKHIPLAVTLARELGMTAIRISDMEEGHLFRDDSVKILMRYSNLDGAKGVIKFSYSIGIDSPFPVRTTGRGKVVVRFRGGDGITISDITYKLFLNRTIIDKIALKIPSLLEMYFSYKTDELIKRAENLGEIMRDDPELIMETLNEAEEVFTTADKKEIEKLLKGKRNS